MFLLLQSTHRMLVRCHPQAGHLCVPNLRARLPNDRGGYFVVTNSLGFRSGYEFEKRRGQRPRVLMFGDSYTAGDNCPNEDRYSDFLARMLDCEVYNFGVSGSGTDQHLLIWREFARDIEADLVMVCVQIDSIRRIQLSHRESRDRITGRRVKNDRRFPVHAVNYVLEEGGVQPRELAAVVYYDNAPLTFERILHTHPTLAGRASGAWQRVLPSWVRYKLGLARLIRDYLKFGFEIGSHTVNHWIVTRCGPEEIRSELAASRREAEQRLGVPCNSFCYPNGGAADWSEETAAAVRAASYRAAYILPDKIQPGGQVNAYAINRVMVPGHASESAFRARVSGTVEALRGAFA